MKTLVTLTLLGATLLQGVSSSHAIAANEFKSFLVPIRKVIERKQLEDMLFDAAARKEGAYVFKLVGGLLGVTPTQSEVARVILASFAKQGEGTDVVELDFDVPGYVLCRADFVETSGAGNRALNVWTKATGIRYVLWVKGTEYLKGRNWAQGTFNISLVEASQYQRHLSDGTCQPHNAHIRSGGMG